MNLWEFKVTFDGILENYVEGKIIESKKLLNNDNLSKYVEYIDTFIFSGGKRIRPYWLWIAYKGFWWEDEKAILNFWIMFELFHTMALIHDDIIDQSEKRHNILTIHQYINSTLDTPDKHIAEGQAMLIGDLLISRVYELRYKQHDFPEELLLKARENVHWMIEEVILWQMIDVEMMSWAPATTEMIEKKNMYKTAWYTFIRPMLTWAILAWADEESQKLIIQLWTHIGLAFQIKDDLSDITLWDTTKSLFSDIQEWQQTFFTNYIFTQGTDENKNLLSSCMKRKLNEEEITKLQTMFQTSWAIEHGKALIQKHTESAQKTLAQIPFKDTSVINGIHSLITKISDFKTS